MLDIPMCYSNSKQWNKQYVEHIILAYCKYANNKSKFAQNVGKKAIHLVRLTK